MRLGLLSIFCVWLLTPTPLGVAADPPCPEGSPRLATVTERLQPWRVDPADPEWQRTIVRYPPGDSRHVRSPAFSNYSQNLANSINEVFDPWFRTGTEDSFVDMLERQWDHITGRAVNPAEGNYHGYFTGMYSGRGGGNSTPFYGKRRLGIVSIAISPSDFRTPIFYSDLRSRLPNPGQPDARTPIEGISDPTDLPSVFNSTEGHPVVIYPHPSIINRYLRRMAEVMELIRAEPDQTRLLDLLSVYYQLGISAHTYERINNSLLMAQVNYILTRRGLRGISHRDLDILAITRSTAEFRTFFIRDVLDAQAGR